MEFHEHYDKLKRSESYFEGLEVVDEDVGHPQVVDEVEVDGDERLLVALGAGVLEEAAVELQARLAPLHVEVQREGDAEVAVVDLQHVRDVDLDGDLVGAVADGNVHAGIVLGQADVGGDAGAARHVGRQRGASARASAEQRRREEQPLAHPPAPHREDLQEERVILLCIKLRINYSK